MKGTRLPEDWMLPAEWRTWALAHIDKRLALDAFTANDYTSEIADNFADYWISKSSAATKLNWQRTWQVWVRREVQTNGWRIEKRTEAGRDGGPAAAGVAAAGPRAHGRSEAARGRESEAALRRRRRRKVPDVAARRTDAPHRAGPVVAAPRGAARR